MLVPGASARLRWQWNTSSVIDEIDWAVTRGRRYRATMTVRATLDATSVADELMGWMLNPFCTLTRTDSGPDVAIAEI
jgi:hypothetical protein